MVLNMFEPLKFDLYLAIKSKSCIKLVVMVSNVNYDTHITSSFLQIDV